MSGEFNPMFAGFAYVEQIKEQEGLTTAEVVKKYGHTAIYQRYYPDGYSACCADQKCRGNEDAQNACLRLMQGDPSGIKRVKGMAKGAIFMGECNHIFTTTKLGPMMEATAISGSVIVNAITGDDPYRDTGGIGSTTPETSVLQEAGTKVADTVGGWKMPSLPKFGLGFKAMSGAVVLFALAIIALIAIGYSGMGGSAGRVAEREHRRKR